MQLTQKQLKKIILEEIENLTNNEQDPKPDEDKESLSREKIKTRMKTMAVSGMESIDEREIPYIKRLLDIISYFNFSTQFPANFNTKLTELENTLPKEE